MWHVTLLLILSLASSIAESEASFNFIVFHAPTYMSHAKVLHQVTRDGFALIWLLLPIIGKCFRELLRRGHRVTTVHFAMEQDLEFDGAGENHTQITLYLNNSEGTLARAEKSEKAVFRFDNREHFDHGLYPLGPWDVLPIVGRSFVQEGREFSRLYCDALLGNRAVLDRLRSQRFDASVMDLMYCECSIVLMADMGVPVVGFWAASPVAGHISHTTINANPTYVPYFITGYSNRMSFLQRVKNAFFNLSYHAMMSVAFAELDIWYASFPCPAC